GELLAEPLPREPGHLGTRPQPQQPVVQAMRTPLWMVAPGRRGKADHAALARQLERAERDPLVHQRRGRYLPALADFPDPVAVWYRHAGQEHLIELGLAGRLPQRPDLDAWRVHVDADVSKPLVLRQVGVAPGDQDGPARDVRRRRPDLLPVDDPPVAVTYCPGRQVRQVRTRTGLAEKLAPDLFASPQRSQPALLLLVGPEGEYRRRGHAKTDAVAFWPVGRRARGGELGVDDLLLRARKTLAAEPDRIVHPGKPGVEPGSDELKPLGRRGVVLGKESANMLAERPGVI